MGRFVLVVNVIFFLIFLRDLFHNSIKRDQNERQVRACRLPYNVMLNLFNTFQKLQNVWVTKALMIQYMFSKILSFFRLGSYTDFTNLEHFTQIFDAHTNWKVVSFFFNSRIFRRLVFHWIHLLNHREGNIHVHVKVCPIMTYFRRVINKKTDVKETFCLHKGQHKRQKSKVKKLLMFT